VDNLLPLMVVIPLGAAFLIPLLSLFTARRNWAADSVIAVVATALLIAFSIVAFCRDGNYTSWIGGYRGEHDLLGITGRVAEGEEAAGEDRAILVEGVAPGSRADTAGVAVGDLILQVRSGPAPEPREAVAPEAPRGRPGGPPEGREGARPAGEGRPERGTRGRRGGPGGREPGGEDRPERGAGGPGGPGAAGAAATAMRAAAAAPDQAATENIPLTVGTLNELRRMNSSLALDTDLGLTVVRAGERQTIEVSGGKSIVGIAMTADGLTRLMLIVISVVSFAAMLFSVSYMRGYTKLHLYYSPIMLMIAGMNGVVVSGDLFNIYVFLEVAAVASYALVGFGVESEELEASFKYLVLSAVASGFILLGIGIVYSMRGTLNLAQIADFMHASAPNKPMLLAIGFFLAGFGLKAAMVPFHAWLPDAHPSAPAPVSAMLSGLLIKASGVYVIARLVFNVLGPTTAVAYVMIALGTASMLVGAFLMWGQWDLKRLLAYSSISHMGLVVLALGVGAEALAGRAGGSPAGSAVAFFAIAAGLFHMVNHAAFKSLLFLTAGSIVHRVGTRDMRDLGGLGRRMPLTALCVRVGSLSISGVPPFNGFFSKLLVVIAVCWAGHWILGAAVALGSLVTLLAFVKVQRYVVEGECPERLAGVRESPAPMLAAMGLLAFLCLGLGLLLPLHRHILLDPAVASLGSTTSGYVRSVLGG
jgi:multicomponent Na+:H+ antiporter subunit D